jgi:hypothetical protein
MQIDWWDQRDTPDLMMSTDAAWFPTLHLSPFPSVMPTASVAGLLAPRRRRISLLSPRSSEAHRRRAPGPPSKPVCRCPDRVEREALASVTVHVEDYSSWTLFMQRRERGSLIEPPNRRRITKLLMVSRRMAPEDVGGSAR